MPGFLGPFPSDNCDSAASELLGVAPPLGVLKARAGERAGRPQKPRPAPGPRPKNSGSPSPTRAPRARAAAHTSAPQALRPGPDARWVPCARLSCHPGGALAGEGWGVPERPRAEGEGKEGGFATIPRGGGGRGSGGGGGGWRRRQRRRRRCPGTPPLPLSPAPARPGPAPAPRPAPRAAQPALTLQRPALPAR